MVLRSCLWIVLLLGLGLNAQINPPALRCIEVLPNGNVKLTWLPVSDPNNTFQAYEIYTFTNTTAQFTLAGTVSAIGQNTFVHAGVDAGKQSVYYFVACRYGSGNSLSNPSDTLQSIYLNILSSTSAQDVKLKYNSINKPNPASASSTYTINKEFPSNSWNTFKITDLTSYPDTISVCTASLFYQVTLADQSGCISRSNVQGGIFHDTKQPDEPYVDSISVLPDGKTVLAWKVPYDKDIVKYEIQYLNVNGQRNVLDIVPGRNSTAYTYSTTAALTSDVGLYVASIDSCSKGSTLNYNVSTMFLKTAYNRCGYSTGLTWNSYQFMPGGLKEYRVYYSVNGGPFELIGSTTQTSFTHAKADAGQNLTYFVRAVNADNSITSSSNRVSFKASQVVSPSFVYIKDAGYYAPGKIIVNVIVDTLAPLQGVDVWRSEDGSTYKLAGFIANTGAAQYAFVDEFAEAGQRSFFYKAMVKDSCGNNRTQSNICRTIFLRSADVKDELFKRSLSWTAYEGFNAGIKEYEVYRIVNDVMQSVPVVSTKSFVLQYTDDLESVSDQGARIMYMVKAIESPGNTYNVNGESWSNPATVYLDDNLFVPSAFAPNGANRVWKPVTGFVDITEYNVRIFDRWGHIVFETSDLNTGWDGADTSDDSFAYLISYKNSRGEYKEKKGSVYLLR